MFYSLLSFSLPPSHEAQTSDELWQQLLYAQPLPSHLLKFGSWFDFWVTSEGLKTLRLHKNCCFIETFWNKIYPFFFVDPKRLLFSYFSFFFWKRATKREYKHFNVKKQQSQPERWYFGLNQLMLESSRCSEPKVQSAKTHRGLLTFLLFEVVGVFGHPESRLDFNFIVAQKILQRSRAQFREKAPDTTRPTEPV